MTRMKVRVAPDADFGQIVGEASKLGGVVALEDKKRRYFIVEVANPQLLDDLRRLGCEITPERRYDIDSATA